MISENLAERLFCDLKNANIKIEKPEYVLNGAKIGQFENTKQFAIFGVKRGNNFIYNFGYGPALSYPDNNSDDSSFTEAYTDLLEAIKSFGPTIKFYSLIIPNKAVMEAKLEEFNTVVSRYIKDYLPATDDLVERWDVMVQKVTKNA